MIVRYINAQIIDKNSNFNDCVVTTDGIISYVGPIRGCPITEFDSTVDVKGYALMPSFIDMHCHLRDPGYTEKETLETGMKAALSGGYTTLCAMANTNPICSTPELVSENVARAKRLNLCNLIQCAAAGADLNDEIPSDYAALSKVTRIISNDGATIFSDKFMSNLLTESERHDFIISTHCQPERQIVSRDLALLKKLGGNLHVGHISRLETAQMIREAKEAGVAVTCEVTPHHLIGYDMDYKVNPPLRTKEDTEALIEAIKDGTIDCLSTDHAPHTEADKARGMAGISNIEYAMQVYMKVFHDNGISLKRFSEMSSYNPARLLRMNAGLIKCGYLADMVIVDTEYEGKIERDKMISKSHNTPFDGYEIRGKVLRTIIGGVVKYDNGQLEQKS